LAGTPRFPLRNEYLSTALSAAAYERGALAGSQGGQFVGKCHKGAALTLERQTQIGARFRGESYVQRAREALLLRAVDHFNKAKPCFNSILYAVCFVLYAFAL